MPDGIKRSDTYSTVQIGDVIVKNVADTGVDVVATKEIQCPESIVYGLNKGILR